MKLSLPTDPAMRRILACLEDLRINGIDLAGEDRERTPQVVHEHLDYFQMMLGGDWSEPAIATMIAKAGT